MRYHPTHDFGVGLGVGDRVGEGILGHDGADPVVGLQAHEWVSRHGRAHAFTLAFAPVGVALGFGWWRAAAAAALFPPPPSRSGVAGSGRHDLLVASMATYEVAQRLDDLRHGLRLRPCALGDLLELAEEASPLRLQAFLLAAGCLVE